MQWLINIITEKVLDHFTGIIVAWSGTIANVPDGWALCDGTNGTPDLADKFIKSTLTPGTEHDIGGGYTHDHQFTPDPHTHTFAGVPQLQAGTDFPVDIKSENATGTIDAVSHLPPWYKLAYIMKL